MEMMEFTSTARKDGRWWVVQCDQVPGALSQVTRLEDAADHQREAISMVMDIDESEINVSLIFGIEGRVRDLLDAAVAKRDEAERLAGAASAEIALAVRTLSDDQVSMRDIGTIIGVSHQRVGQILTAARKASENPV